MTANQAAAELACLLTAWRTAHPGEYAEMRRRHNRWQAAHATRLALADWLEERRHG